MYTSLMTKPSSGTYSVIHKDNLLLIEYILHLSVSCLVDPYILGK